MSEPNANEVDIDLGIMARSDMEFRLEGDWANRTQEIEASAALIRMPSSWMNTYREAISTPKILRIIDALHQLLAARLVPLGLGRLELVIVFFTFNLLAKIRAAGQQSAV